MDLVRVSMDNLGNVGAATQAWGFTDVPRST